MSDGVFVRMSLAAFRSLTPRCKRRTGIDSENGRITVFRNAVVIGDGYLQTADGEWPEKDGPRYNQYLILDEVELGDAIAITCANGLGIAPSAYAELAVKNSAVIVEINMPGHGSEDEGHRQAGVALDDS